jgi:hypothetical protein
MLHIVCHVAYTQKTALCIMKFYNPCNLFTFWIAIALITVFFVVFPQLSRKNKPSTVSAGNLYYIPVGVYEVTSATQDESYIPPTGWSIVRYLYKLKNVETGRIVVATHNSSLEEVLHVGMTIQMTHHGRVVRYKQQSSVVTMHNLPVGDYYVTKVENKGRLESNDVEYIFLYTLQDIQTDRTVSLSHVSNSFLRYGRGTEISKMPFGTIHVRYSSP